MDRTENNSGTSMPSMYKNNFNACVLIFLTRVVSRPALTNKDQVTYLTDQ